MAAAPLITNNQQQVANALTSRMRELEKAQVAQRTQSARRELDHNRQLFTARRTAKQAQVQLEEKENILQEQQQRIQAQDQTIVTLQQNIDRLTQERDILQLQFNQQEEVNEAAKEGLRRRLNVTNIRLQQLQQALAQERAIIQDKYLLNSCRHRLFYLKNDKYNDNRIYGLGMTTFMGLSYIIGGPIGFGVSYLISAASPFVKIQIDRPRNEEMKRLKRQIQLIEQRLNPQE
jgi:hypothetical protein